MTVLNDIMLFSHRSFHSIGNGPSSKQELSVDSLVTTESICSVAGRIKRVKKDCRKASFYMVLDLKIKLIN